MQTGQTDVTVFEGYICEIYEDLDSSARPQQESAQVLPTKKAPRGIRGNEVPPRAAKLPLVRAANREHPTEVLRPRPAASNPQSIAPHPESRRQHAANVFPAAHSTAQPSSAQPLLQQARRMRSGDVQVFLRCVELSALSFCALVDRCFIAISCADADVLAQFAKAIEQLASSA